MNSIELLQRKMKIYGLSTAKKLEIVTLFEQAKHLHKQEIIDAYDKGYLNLKLGDDDAGKEYYKETFEK
jgi:hypothetical protein